MISEGPALIEALPGALQNALNGALRPDEELLIAVRGNQREAFAATNTRLLVLKEPVISGTAPVEVQDLDLSEVTSIRSVPRPVGGRLMWETARAGAPTSIDYPTYDGSKYSLVAGRMQQMIGQKKDAPTPGGASVDPTLGSGAGTSPCPKCSGAVPVGGSWCPTCGLQVTDPCWACSRPLSPGANFCGFCGTPNSEPAVIQCSQCRAVVGPQQGWCTACGIQARPVCQSCEAVMRKDWSYCPACGGEPAGAEGSTAPEPERLEVKETANSRSVSLNPPPTASGEEANAAGIRAYEIEDYEQAVRHFRIATAAEPNNASYFTNLGVAYGELEDDTQALRAYRRALELNPAELAAYLNLGYLYNGQERSNEAREMWEKVIALAPGSEEAQEARENLEGLEHV